MLQTIVRSNSHEKPETERELIIDLSSKSPPPGPLVTLPVYHSLFCQHYDSELLHNQLGSAEAFVVSTSIRETYGNPKHHTIFNIGNGGAGYTGILDVLCNAFIRNHGADFRIAWIPNHSRLSQIALLGDVVQVALTYEPEAERLAVAEGWCKQVCDPAFWDHFVIAGPKNNPADVRAGCISSEALKAIAEKGALFHTRGDGSATFAKERYLWKTASVDTSLAEWLQTHVCAPYEALKKAAAEGAYLLTDRSTFLTAKNANIIPDMVIYVEGGEQLLNPCSALINTKVPDSPGQRLAIQFAEWLGGHQAQGIIRGYGRDWQLGLPLFTEARYEEFGSDEVLVGRGLSSRWQPW